LPLREVKRRKKNLPTPHLQEFTFLNELYYREEVKQFSTYTSVGKPNLAREKSSYKPNLIN
jgi:hypothetical protein